MDTWIIPQIDRRIKESSEFLRLGRYRVLLLLRQMVIKLFHQLVTINAVNLTGFFDALSPGGWAAQPSSLPTKARTSHSTHLCT